MTQTILFGKNQLPKCWSGSSNCPEQTSSTTNCPEETRGITNCLKQTYGITNWLEQTCDTTHSNVGEHDADSKVESAWLFVNDVGGGAVHPQGVEH